MFHKCYVVVNDEDLDDAREILAARPEEEIEVSTESSADEHEMLHAIPGFFSIWIGATLLSLVLGVFCGSLHVFVSIFKRHPKLDQPDMDDAVFNAPVLILWSPFFVLQQLSALSSFCFRFA